MNILGGGAYERVSAICVHQILTLLFVTRTRCINIRFCNLTRPNFLPKLGRFGVLPLVKVQKSIFTINFSELVSELKTIMLL